MQIDRNADVTASARLGDGVTIDGETIIEDGASIGRLSRTGRAGTYFGDGGVKLRSHGEPAAELTVNALRAAAPKPRTLEWPKITVTG